MADLSINMNPVCMSEKENLQEKQREYPYFMFDASKRDHQVERAKMISAYKERIQKTYLHKFKNKPRVKRGNFSSSN